MTKKNIDQQILIDSIGDGIMIVDRKGIIKNTNKAICDMLGYKSKDAMEGQVCLVFLGAIGEMGEVIDKKNAAFYRSIKYKKSIKDEKRQFIKQDGTRIWTNITTSPLKDSNKIIGAIIIIRDITKAKEHEEYHEDFAHNASHNLRSPIGNLLWVTEYLLTKKPGPLTVKQTEYLSDAYESLQSMNRLINNLLNISRLENKKIKPDFQKISLNKTINDVLKDLKFFAKAQRITIELNPTLKKEWYVKADDSHLHTIIQNLIENALRYGDQKTKVVLNIKKNRKNIIFSCQNKGLQIPKDKEKLIFAKFFRTKEAEERQNEGTGLGLYTSRELTILNNGKIWFKNTPNKTVTFYLELNSYN
ncbi:MAG: hypothetical protein A2725_04215 [Candidatus Magasanikbacteria bacterium RIFCSPHIGHO2_01_FULL_33_34]|uniref:histidine kinase n=1 Tax=Candidatus Magasanikbacteria bacterium RIFCSPHIGHO2_01_FULL_33_34 TaxID=1798671 RepID=A0A1F6LHZ1_9BACT|nr:MAG: hypothetical protein A2725_04215 [Candidatus Magasanikbacteria bacterium RIFCSPHIGHO2_01_FULL_33_34]OGH65170.1 MAG: hypothetical protein A3B83_03975 [Candidatus Magasanikbacteria bacterium RIFCSPHIGHO2_02_FULL_33_17]OGH75285.1 MAG: hypothetical protein A3A89_04190 [Candidatus Magasanikbacteria bacterium RIFCSPLOWO2_01_FULL_33_34]